eukprot:CAMPEP_0202960502 /NCGR_PEP_ID=MMETSP1396-20130829/4642_1 /ASSEMBLY_ACC=CAM_ASM_000872 /TAXON_ID= /ORGANISM="Pseudokeronopsis sp., Strain Brazil" /LENGTH=264 /DNA_ID=CAMNT_0049679753 /DNA_START=432 /DNA_END=1226 /DNA_ORIENTATION=-
MESNEEAQANPSPLEMPHFYQPRYCTTCLIIRPPLSSHCGACNQCVKMWDHHCNLINNCLGANNYKYFVHICYFGLYMAIVEIMAFVYYYIDLSQRGTPQCDMLTEQYVIGIVVLTAVSVLLTAMGAGGCCFILLGGAGYLTLKLKECVDSYEVIMPIVGLGISCFFLAIIPGYFQLHTYLMMHDMTTKEYETLKREKKFEYIYKKKTKISWSERFSNWFNIFILNSRKGEYELRRPIHKGIPLEYEATDPDLFTQELTDYQEN